MLGHQQVTAYCFKDSNNDWRIKPPHDASSFDSSAVDTDSGVKYVRSGDRIRLEHVQTGKNLHSLVFPAPLCLTAFIHYHLTTFTIDETDPNAAAGHDQVSGFGVNGTGDAGDDWTIVLQHDELDGEGLIRRIGDPILLVHGIVGYTRLCALSTSSKALPEWGQEQVRRCVYVTSSRMKLWSSTK